MSTNSSTKRLSISIDNWFERFLELPDHAGYLPDLGVQSMVVDTVGMPSCDPQTLTPSGHQQLNEILFAAPAYHYMGAVAVCFWDHAQCWKCKSSFAAHSIVAKKALVRCDVTVQEAVFPNHEKCLVLKPIIEIDAVGTDFSLLPYAIHHLDKMVANCWRQIALDVKVTGHLKNPATTLAHRYSQQYGDCYLGLHCPNCSMLQGEHFLKPHAQSPGADDKPGPMHAAPDLMVVPLLQGQATLGGVAVTRLLLQSA